MKLLKAKVDLHFSPVGPIYAFRHFGHFKIICIFMVFVILVLETRKLDIVGSLLLLIFWGATKRRSIVVLCVQAAKTARTL